MTDYAPDDFFNTDESALFFKLLLDKTLAFKDETCTECKHAKGRILVSFGVNLSGTEKLPLLVIWKSAKLRCSKEAPDCGLESSTTAIRNVDDYETF